MLRLVFEDRPWTGGDESARVVNRWYDASGRAFATGVVGTDRRWIDWAGVGVFCFHDHSPNVLFHPASGVDPDLASDTFARVIQPLVLQAKGLPVLHSSAAAGPHGAIAFCGLSGSGKSTLAYAVGRSAGFDQLADDAVVIRPAASGAFDIEALPFRPKLRPSAANFFQAPPSSGSERLTFPSRPLCAVVLLTQISGPAAPTIVRVAPASAFRMLLTHAHCFDQTDRRTMGVMVETYFSLAAAVPVFELTYAPDFRALPQLVSLVRETIAESSTSPQ